MAVIPSELEAVGWKLRQISQRTALPPELELGSGPLSVGVAAAQNLAGTNARGFAGTVDAGLAVAGDGLIHYAKGVAATDDQSAAAIEQLFPEQDSATPPPPAPPTRVGGR